MMLHWVECRCARCWTSAANTLETPIATLPSPISENWSGWCLAVFPRYTVFFFLCRSDTTLSIFILGICQKVCTSGVMCKLKDDYPFHQNTVGWFNYTTDNEAHADRTWFQDGWLSCIFPPGLCFFFLSFFYSRRLFLSWTVCWLIESLFRSGVRRFGRGWEAKVCPRVRWAALTHTLNTVQLELYLFGVSSKECFCGVERVIYFMQWFRFLGL